MSVLLDMLGAYRAPATTFRRRLEGSDEARALVVLVTACVLIFAAQWPRLQREAIMSGQDFGPLMGGALFGWIFLMPLIAYGLGTLSHLIAKPLGGKGSGFSARFALFWALLVASPLWLLWGLVAGFIGAGVQMQLVGAVALAAFLGHWGVNLIVAERG